MIPNNYLDFIIFIFKTLGNRCNFVKILDLLLDSINDNVDSGHHLLDTDIKILTGLDPVGHHLGGCHTVTALSLTVIPSQVNLNHFIERQETLKSITYLKTFFKHFMFGLHNVH